MVRISSTNWEADISVLDPGQVVYITLAQESTRSTRENIDENIVPLKVDEVSGGGD